MAELIPAGSDTSAWFDVTVTDTHKALYIKGAPGTTGPVPNGVEFDVAHKSGSDYTIFDTLDSGNIADKGVLAAPGVFGLRRTGSGGGIGGLDVEG